MSDGYGQRLGQRMRAEHAEAIITRRLREADSAVTRGNTVNRASIDNKPAEPEIVVTHLMEGIGIVLDVPNDRMFVTDFPGWIYSARLYGSGERNFLYAEGNLTGIAFAKIPKEK